jgi:membrane-bound serine protease (ClpP class)
MIYLALGLSLAAVVMIVVDIFLEGFGILGVLGLLVMAASIFVNVVYVPFGIFIVIGKTVVLVVAGVFFFRYLKQKKLYGKFILKETLMEDEIDFSALEHFVGKEGITKTALRPFGKANIDGANIEVCSDAKYIPANKHVKVVELKERKLFVTAIDN